MRAPRRRSAGARAGTAAAVAALAVAAALPAGAAAQGQKAGTVTATAGAVRATLSWQAAEQGAGDPRLVIERGGATAYSGSAFPARDACGSAGGGCALLASGRRDSPLQALDLDADGEPEVLVDAFTGGAHCCAETVVWRRQADGGYAGRVLEWGNGGYEVRQLDRRGSPELVTQDDRFAAVFTAFAASYPPVRVVRFGAARSAGIFDVTRRFPTEVRRDLRAVRRDLRRERRRRDAELRGLIAAEVADLYRLGESRAAVRTLDAHIRRGDAGPRAQARSFRRQLLRFLRRTGYR